MADSGYFMLPEGFDYTIPPVLKDIDFWFWKARMTSFIKAYDFDMWNVFTNAFDHKPRKDWTDKEKKMFSLNIRAMKFLYSAVTENDFEKIRFCSNAKAIWDTLDSIYTSNKYVEVKSVDSSCTTTICAPTIHEQLEVGSKAEEIVEHFHRANTDRKEEEDSQEEFMDKCDESLSEALDELKVKSSNPPYDFCKTDFQSSHKTVFHPITDSVEKSKNVFDYAGNLYMKKELKQTEYLRLPSLRQHNICIEPHNVYHHIICNYCGKFGHISHTCYIRRNSNMRNKYIWVPKGHVKSNANNQGPKYMWVPKCPSSVLSMQDDSKRNGHKGTEKMKKKARGSHALKKFVSSRTLETFIVGAIKHNHRTGQWRKTICSTSTKGYHRVPFNYIEENKKRRISRTKLRTESSTHERTLHNPKTEHAKTKFQGKMHWVSKGDPSST